MTGAPVLIVQHEPGEGPGLLGRALDDAGITRRLVRTFAGEPVPRTLGDAAGLVVLGGSMAVYEQERHPHLGHELELLRDALRRKRPILGLCLGSQLLAAALGGTVAKAKAKELGWYRVRLAPAAADDALLSGAPPDFVAFHWHGDACPLPPGAVQLASSTLTRCQAFRAGTNAWGFQFHPEVDEEIIGAMVSGGADELASEGVDGAQLLAAAARELPRVRDSFGAAFARWIQLLT